MAIKGLLDAQLAELGLNGFTHIASGDGDVTPPGGSSEFFLLVPANGTSPTINQSNTEVSTGDKPVDGQAVTSEGLYGPFTQINLSAGEVYAYHA